MASVVPLNKVPKQIEHNAQLLMQVLEGQGFEITRGCFKLWRAEDCPYTYQRMGWCFRNNPVASNLWGPSGPGYTSMSIVSIPVRRSSYLGKCLALRFISPSRPDGT